MSMRPDSHESASINNGSSERILKHKRRYCRAVGCTRIVKSQGLCQRHGAKPKECKVESCKKQAQGNFAGMCKSHYKVFNPPSAANVSSPGMRIPCSESIYDRCLLAFTEVNSMEPPIPSPKKSEDEDEDDDVAPLNFWDETAGVVDQACAEAIVATGLIDYEPKRKPMINRLLPFEAFTEDGLFIVQRSATDKHWKPV